MFVRRNPSPGVLSDETCYRVFLADDLLSQPRACPGKKPTNQPLVAIIKMSGEVFFSGTVKEQIEDGHETIASA